MRTGTAKASATRTCGLLIGGRIRGTAMLEFIHTLNACMLWKFGYSFFGL